MAIEKRRFVTESVTQNNTGTLVIFNSDSAITYTLLAASGTGRQEILINLGAGKVTIAPYDEDTILGESYLYLQQGGLVSIYDVGNEMWWKQDGSNEDKSFYTITDPGASAATTAAIIDGYGGVVITTTTTGNNQTLASPTVTYITQSFKVINNDTSTNSITVNGVVIAVGDSQTFLWDGTAWSDVDISTDTGGSNYVDDAFVTWGTTTTNAETKITIEFDETTTGIGQKRMGDLTNAQILNKNPGATVVGDIINITHSAGAGNCDDLMGLYIKNSIIGVGDSGTTIVPLGTRAYVGSGSSNAAAKEVYAIQPWAKHSGTGSMVAMSAVSAALILNDGDAFESTNSINSGHFHIKTASGQVNGTVTSSNFDGVFVEVYGNVVGLGAMLHLSTNSDVTNGILIDGNGSFTNVIDLTNATLTQGESNAIISFGSIDNAKTVEITENYVPLQIFVSATSDGGSDTLAAEYLKVENSTDSATLQLCSSLLRVELNGAADSAYGLQSHIGTKATVSGIDNVAAVSAKIDMDNAITTSYAVQAGLFIMEGVGVITGNSHAIQACVENGTTINNMIATTGSGTATNILYMSTTNRTNVFAFDAASGPISSETGTSFAADGVKIKILVGTETYYLRASKTFS